jgi:hypothetical protein
VKKPNPGSAADGKLRVSEKTAGLPRKAARLFLFFHTEPALGGKAAAEAGFPGYSDFFSANLI